MLCQSYFLLQILTCLIVWFLDQILLLLLLNSPCFIRPLRFVEKILISIFLIFLKLLKRTWIMCHQHLHNQYFFIGQYILFFELLLDQNLILFVYSNQLQLVYSDFCCNYNPANILQYNLHCGLSLAFIFLRIVLIGWLWTSFPFMMTLQFLVSSALYLLELGP